jgi:hypothetical protein
MSRRIAIRFMLSLLLLLSQQMALTHAMSHWAGSSHVQQLAGEEDSRLSAAVAQDQSCDQCLALAQIAGAVGSSEFHFVAGAGARLGVGTVPAEGPFSPAHPPFHSRAPPALS